MSIISVDFDVTLTIEEVYNYIQTLIADGHEVWILTRRNDNVHRIDHKNEDLFRYADDLGIGHARIRFQNGFAKFHWLHNSRVDLHLDDDQRELDDIGDIGVNINDEDWIEQANSKI